MDYIILSIWILLFIYCPITKCQTVLCDIVIPITLQTPVGINCLSSTCFWLTKPLSLNVIVCLSSCDTISTTTSGDYIILWSSTCMACSFVCYSYSLRIPLCRVGGQLSCCWLVLLWLEIHLCVSLCGWLNYSREWREALRGLSAFIFVCVSSCWIIWMHELCFNQHNG